VTANRQRTPRDPAQPRTATTDRPATGGPATGGDGPGRGGPDRPGSGRSRPTVPAPVPSAPGSTADAGELDATVDPQTAALLAQLADWVAEHGSAEVPQSGRSRLDPPGERPLGKRLYYARSKYARGTLPAPVARALERFPGWTWTPYQATLDRHLAAVDSHFRVQGRTTRLGLPADTYAWLNSASHRGYTGLPPDVAERLRALVPGTVRGRGTARFLAAAQTWLSEHPDLTMTDLRARDTTTLDGQVYALGAAARTYRSRAAGDPNRAPLSNAETADLERLPGWTWTPPRSRRSVRRAGTPEPLPRRM